MRFFTPSRCRRLSIPAIWCDSTLGYAMLSEDDCASFLKICAGGQKSDVCVRRSALGRLAANGKADRQRLQVMYTATELRGMVL